jgi:hypothetical protein
VATRCPGSISPALRAMRAGEEVGEVEVVIDRTQECAAFVGSELREFGGVLRCLHCGHEEPLGDVAHHLAHGWPRCCGYTMRWLTQRELDAEKEVPADV